MTVVSDSVWYIYIARCADGSFYTGVARNVSNRMAQHNRGKGAKYTRGRLPLELVYVEKSSDRSSALRRECQIKRMDSAEKRRLIEALASPHGSCHGVTR